jgi:protein-disulfide isomerase
VIMRHLFIYPCVFAILLFAARTVSAQTRVCDALKGAQRDVAMRVLKSQHPHDCCDDTILKCLKKRPACKLAIRLANDVCRRAAAGQSQGDIQAELVRRASSAFSAKVAIDVSSSTLVGDPHAPVEIVVYLCARCPYCARLTPQLYRSITEGDLKGKVKLFVRPFPIRSHRYSTVGAKAMLAAARLGKFWPFLLHLYKNFGTFNPDRLPEYAGKIGLDPERFRVLLTDPEVERTLVSSKKEGIRNQVDATPTLFINRRKYSAELSMAAIEDFVGELLEAH